MLPLLLLSFQVSLTTSPNLPIHFFFSISLHLCVCVPGSLFQQQHKRRMKNTTWPFDSHNSQFHWPTSKCIPIVCLLACSVLSPFDRRFSTTLTLFSFYSRLKRLKGLFEFSLWKVETISINVQCSQQALNCQPMEKYTQPAVTRACSRCEV